MQITRTQDEILNQYHARKDGDVLGFEVQEYLFHLDYDHVKEFLKEGVTEKEWGLQPCTRDAVLAKMKDYMEFAWDKANNRRGISANRSVMHYIAWIWLAGDDEFFKEINSDFENDYHFYGKPILEKICKKYGWDYSQWDDGIRSNYEN